jgi:mannan endo-1,4-beta-mannosidase
MARPHHLPLYPVLLLPLLLLTTQAPSPASAASFVATSGHQLTLDGAPFYFVGANAFWMSNAGAGDVDGAMGAASAIGVRVIRTWAFGDQLPDQSTGEYTWSQLDSVVSSAARHGIRLILALGNTWSYGGPKQWLGDSAAGKTIADFYASPDARQRYKDHIATVTSRYAGDPTVLAWDVINEPRCPGCDGGQIAARNAWLDEMVGAVRASAPNQLVLLASEGFYGPSSPNVSKNPGAGSACEGEDWESGSANWASAATAHVYWRQVEGTPDLGWEKPGFNAYLPYLAARLDLHESIAQQQLGKPLIVEEFGLSSRFFDAEQTKAAVAVVLDRLVKSKQRGGALAGAMLWGLVSDGEGGSPAGYDWTADGGASASNVGLGSGVGGGGSNAPAAAPAAAAANATSDGGGGNYGAPASSDATSSGGRRRLQKSFQDIVEDDLDAFRRGPQRASCAHSRADGWSFPYSFGEATGVSAEAVKGAVAGTSISSLFKEAASKL